MSKEGDNNIKTLQISPSKVSKLERASIYTIDDLVTLCKREILSIDGIGPKTFDEIVKALDSLGLKLAVDQYKKLICARHNKERNDARLRSFILCEDCSAQFKTQALNNIQPVFVMKMEGGPYRCSHCNELLKVNLYQWYICDICDRVLRSIGRGIAANKGVIAWWESNRENDTSLPRIIETDPPTLRARTGVHAKPKLDFEWINENNITIFGVEAKTGRNHLKGGNIGARMSKFQLDVSDIDSILDAMERDNSFIPTYVFHCQVVDVPEPPTTRYSLVGIWWSLVNILINYIQEIKQRPRENRPAAYINTKAFNEINYFIDEIKSKGYEACPDPSYLKKELDNVRARE